MILKYFYSINKYLNKLHLETQLTIVFLIVSVSAASIFGYFQYQNQITSIKNNKKESFLALSHSISTSLKEDIYDNNFVAIEQKLQGLSEIKEIQKISIFNKQGITISEVQRDKNNGFIATYRYIKKDIVPKDTVIKFDNNERLELHIPINFSGDNQGWIEITSSPEKLQALKKVYIKDILMITSITLFITIISIFIFLKIKLKSLTAIADFSQRLPDDNGKTIDLKNLPNEIETLKNSLNWASKQIHQQHNSLLSHNSLLEIRVKERTKEFEEAKILAEKSSNAKSEFLSSMSHELRTPLNAILGFAQLIKFDTDNSESPEDGSINENIIEILNAGNHLLNLVNEILDLAKIEKDSLHLSIEAIQDNDIINKCITLIKPVARQRNIEVINNIKYEHYIKADPVRLKQIILNLLNNAVKYNRENGHIYLNTGIVDGKRLRFSIQDTGQGISQKNISKLFTPFERLNTKFNAEGAGIGLVISRKLVTLMDGTMGIESVENEGSTFWFELPLAERNNDKKVVNTV